MAITLGIKTLRNVHVVKPYRVVPGIKAVSALAWLELSAE